MRRIYQKLLTVVMVASLLVPLLGIGLITHGSRHFMQGGSPGAPDLLFDDFTYTLDRSQSGAGTAVTILQNGPDVGEWVTVRSENGGDQEDGNGWVYIVDEPTGFSGTLPNPGGRCLVMEGMPDTVPPSFIQTDFYLQYGNNTDPIEYGGIPPEFWMQFWVYSNNTGAEVSDHTARSKWMYGNASISAGQEGGFMLFTGIDAYQRNGWTTTSGNFFIGARPGYLAGPDTGANDASQSGGDIDKLGANLANKPVRGGHWTLVKIHFDVSGSQGSLEWWQREQDEDFVKVGEYIGGVTPNFTWNTSANDRLGLSHFRMPTTVNGLVAGATIYWMYFQDFTIATEENLLPTYPISLMREPELVDFTGFESVMERAA